MLHCVARNVLIALGLTCGLCSAQQDQPDSATYAFFFEKVALLNSGAPFVLNGRDLGVTQPSVQQEMGLTDTEAELLRKIALAYIGKIRTLDETPKRLI